MTLSGIPAMDSHHFYPNDNLTDYSYLAAPSGVVSAASTGSLLSSFQSNYDRRKARQLYLAPLSFWGQAIMAQFQYQLTIPVAMRLLPPSCCGGVGGPQVLCDVMRRLWPVA